MSKPLMFIIIVIFVSLEFLQSNANAKKSKRLLLNDPDIVHARLRQLEKKQQEMTGQMSRQISHLQGQISQQQGQISQLQGNISQQEGHISLQQGQISQLQGDLSSEKTKTAVLEQTIHTMQIRGTTYVRWGRSECSASNTEMIYAGYAAGEKAYHGSSYTGGASNMLCLPSSPELSNKTISASSQLYGTEYNDPQFGSSAVNEDVPCAVCRSINTSSSLMIPGRKSGFAGWKKEYDGIIASGAYVYASSSFICVDAHPTYISGGSRNNNDNIIYVTAMKCGSLPCPPYKDNLEVFCVVCSK